MSRRYNRRKRRNYRRARLRKFLYLNKPIKHEVEHLDTGNWAWAAASASVWSYSKDPYKITLQDDGSNLAYRGANEIHYGAFKYRFRIKQPINEELDYRFLLVKHIAPEQGLVSVDWKYDPEQILLHTGTVKDSLLSSYKEKASTQVGLNRAVDFIVLKDFRVNLNSSNYDQEHDFTIRFPPCNVTYASSQVDGRYRTNQVVLYILTDATPTDAQYVLTNEQYRLRWFESND